MHGPPPGAGAGPGTVCDDRVAGGDDDASTGSALSIRGLSWCGQTCDSTAHSPTPGCVTCPARNSAIAGGVRFSSNPCGENREGWFGKRWVAQANPVIIGRTGTPRSSSFFIETTKPLQYELCMVRVFYEAKRRSKTLDHSSGRAVHAAVMRQRNGGLSWDLIGYERSNSRADIARRVGLSPAAVTCSAARSSEPSRC